MHPDLRSTYKGMVKGPSAWETLYQKIASIWPRLISQFVTHMLQTSPLNKLKESHSTFGGLCTVTGTRRQITLIKDPEFESLRDFFDDNESVCAATDAHRGWTPCEEDLLRADSPLTDPESCNTTTSPLSSRSTSPEQLV